MCCVQLYSVINGFCDVAGCLLCMQDGGSLDKILKSGGRIPVEMIQLISLSVCSGLRYLKENHGIIHRGVALGAGLRVVGSSWDIAADKFSYFAQM